MHNFTKGICLCLSAFLLTANLPGYAEKLTVSDYDALASATRATSTNASTNTQPETSTTKESKETRETKDSADSVDPKTSAPQTKIQPKTIQPKTLQPKVETQNWANEALAWTNQEGILLGDGKGHYFPDRPVNQSELSIFIAKYKGEPNLPAYDKNAKILTRSEVATYVSNALKLNEIEPVKLPYTDVASSSSEVVAAFSTLLQSNLISGYPDQTLKPNKTISRAEVAVILYKARLMRNMTSSSYERLANTIITKGSVTLENKVIAGNLYITAGVADQEVYLKNVQVEGNLLIEGGGVNSVYIESSKIANLVINKEASPVRVVFSKGSSVESTEILKPTILKIDTTVKIKSMTIDANVKSLTINESTYVNPAKLESIALNSDRMPISPYKTAKNYTQPVKSTNIDIAKVVSSTSSATPTTSGSSQNNSGHNGNSGSGSNSGSNSGGNANLPKPVQPGSEGLISTYLVPDKSKWLQIEGTHYLVLTLKQAANGLILELDGTKANYSPVNSEQSIIKVECSKLPAQISLKKNNNLTEVFSIAQLLKVNTAKSLGVQDIIIQNTLKANQNTKLVSGEITVMLPSVSTAAFKPDTISGATPKGSTASYYIENLPQGLNIQSSLSPDRKSLSLRLLGNYTLQGNGVSQTMTLKLLSSAIQGDILTFTQLDRPINLIEDTLSPQPSTPTPQSTTKIVNIEGVNYLVVQLKTPWKPESVLKVNDQVISPSFVNQEKTILKFELVQPIIRQLSIIVDGQERPLTIPN